MARTRTRQAGEHPGQRGLAGSRSAPQNQGGKRPTRVDQPPHQTSLADEVLLADEFVERARTHPLGEGRIGSTACGSSSARPKRLIVSSLAMQRPPSGVWQDLVTVRTDYTTLVGE